MKNALFSLAMIFMMAACTPPEAPEDPMIAVHEANTQTVYDYIAAMTTGDVNAAASFLTDDYYYYGPNIADSASKVDHLSRWKGNLDSLFTKVTYSRIATITQSYEEGRLQGDWVADWSVMSIDYQNAPSVSFNFHAVYRVEEGKITRSTSFFNQADILTQQGWQMTPPPSEDAE